MKTTSKLGYMTGAVIVAISLWRWAMFYSEVIYGKLIIGVVVGLLVMAFAYISDWMAKVDDFNTNLSKRLDSQVQDFRGMKELNSLK